MVEVRAAGPDEAGAVLALWRDARSGHAVTPDRAFWAAAGYDPDPVMGRFVRSL